MMKTIHNSPDNAKVEMMGPLFHWYRVPPDSSAKTSSTEAARRDTAPMKSTRRVALRENLARSLAVNVESLSALLAGKNMAMMRIAKAPGGPLPDGSAVPKAHSRWREGNDFSLKQENPSPGGTSSYGTANQWAGKACNGEDRRYYANVLAVLSHQNKFRADDENHRVNSRQLCHGARQPASNRKDSEECQGQKKHSLRTENASRLGVNDEKACAALNTITTGSELRLKKTLNAVGVGGRGEGKLKTPYRYK